MVSARNSAGAANNAAAASVARTWRALVMMASPLFFGRYPGALQLPAGPDFRRSSSPAGPGNTIAPKVRIGERCPRSAVLHFLEGLAGIAKTVDSGGDAGIDRDLQEDFLDLVLGQPVLQRRLDVQFQLMRAVEHADHRQIDDAAEAAIDAGAGPQRTPAELGRPLRHGAGEFVGAGDRLVDVVLAQHFLAHLQSAFEQAVFAHG